MHHACMCVCLGFCLVLFGVNHLLPLAFLGNDENPSIKGKPSLMGSWPTGWVCPTKPPGPTLTRPSLFFLPFTPSAHAHVHWCTWPAVARCCILLPPSLATSWVSPGPRSLAVLVTRLRNCVAAWDSSSTFLTLMRKNYYFRDLVAPAVP